MPAKRTMDQQGKNQLLFGVVGIIILIIAIAALVLYAFPSQPARQNAAINATSTLLATTTASGQYALQSCGSTNMWLRNTSSTVTKQCYWNGGAMAVNFESGHLGKAYITITGADGKNYLTANGTSSCLITVAKVNLPAQNYTITLRTSNASVASSPCYAASLNLGAASTAAINSSTSNVLNMPLTPVFPNFGLNILNGGGFGSSFFTNPITNIVPFLGGGASIGAQPFVNENQLLSLFNISSIPGLYGFNATALKYLNNITGYAVKAGANCLNRVNISGNCNVFQQNIQYENTTVLAKAHYDALLASNQQFVAGYSNTTSPIIVNKVNQTYGNLTYSYYETANVPFKGRLQMNLLAYKSNATITALANVNASHGINVTAIAATISGDIK